MIKRPPLGLPPRFIFDEFRNHLTDEGEILSFDFARWLAVKDALERYHNHQMRIPIEWSFEFKFTVRMDLYHSKYLN